MLDSVSLACGVFILGYLNHICPRLPFQIGYVLDLETIWMRSIKNRETAGFLWKITLEFESSHTYSSRKLIKPTVMMLL